MSWDHADRIFPSGVVRIGDSVITVEELKESDLPYVRYSHIDWLRGLKIRETEYAWGANGEFMRGVGYDIYKDLYHPDTTCYPLNCFGQTMLNNYFYFNEIDPPENN